MTYQGPKVFQKAVEELSKLPGIGEKTAQRLALFLVRSQDEWVEQMVSAVREMKTKVTLCTQCFGYTDSPLCPICEDVRRDQALICVVENPTDIFAIERSGQFRGVYHVLHGRLAPLEGMGPSDLKIESLLKRIEVSTPREVLLATNPDVEGDATALYLGQLLQKKNIPVSRIAMGIPMGGHLEYIDQITLGRAISERRSFLVS